MSDEAVILPEILKEHRYNTYAEVTGPLVRDIGLYRGFDEYNLRSEKMTIVTDWGRELIDRFRSHYKSPWFVLLHIWALHKPRAAFGEYKNSRHRMTYYERAVASVDRYIGRILENIDDALIILTSDHGEEVESSNLDYLLKNLLCSSAVIRFLFCGFLVF